MNELLYVWHLPDIAMCIFLGVIWGLIVEKKGKELYIPDNDSLSSFPYQNLGMKGYINLLIVVLVPYIFYTIFYIIEKYTKSNILQPFDFIGLLCVHLGSILFAGNISHMLKLRVGRPRPDYYAYISEIDATHPKAERMRREAFKSFPSGHSCTAAAGGLSFVLALFKIIGYQQFWCVALEMAPLFYVFYIGSMRITEYRHHTDDVVAGFLIGFLSSLLCFYDSNKVIFGQLSP